MAVVYQAIGRFVVEFSRVVHAMESAIVSALGGEQRAVQALLAEVTATPLSRAWRSVMEELYRPDDEDRHLLSGLFAEIQEIVEVRNDISHSTWFVGYGNEQTTDWTAAGFLRAKNRSAGLTFGSNTFSNRPTVEMLEAQAERASVVADATATLSSLLQLRHIGAVTKTRLGDRVHISGRGNDRVVEVSSDGVHWRSWRPSRVEASEEGQSR